MMQPTGSTPLRIGQVLTRIVVPLWVLAGATFKLVERSPENLPSQIWKTAAGWHIDLFQLLAVLIALEIAIAAVMIFLPRLSRIAAIFMLGVFCLVLLNEMRVGNVTSCGCFGKIPMPPWVMLIIDGSLLLAVLGTGSRQND